MLFKAAVAALSVAGAGCLLSSCDVGPSHTLNSKSVQSQIAEQLRSRYPVVKPVVSCPSGIPDRIGTQFSCNASFEGQSVRLDGEVTSAAGRYSIQPAEAIVSSAQATATLEQDISANVHEPVTVGCGSQPVRVVAAGGQFNCVATIPGQGQRRVTVTVEDLQGHFRYSVEPPSAPVAS